MISNLNHHLSLDIVHIPFLFFLLLLRKHHFSCVRIELTSWQSNKQQLRRPVEYSSYCDKFYLIIIPACAYFDDEVKVVRRCDFCGKQSDVIWHNSKKSSKVTENLEMVFRNSNYNVVTWHLIVNKWTLCIRKLNCFCIRVCFVNVHSELLFSTNFLDCKLIVSCV